MRRVKKGALAETSPMLNDVSGVPSWTKARHLPMRADCPACHAHSTRPPARPLTGPLASPPEGAVVACRAGGGYEARRAQLRRKAMLALVLRPC